ncbi:MAG: 50S ribosomal protein L6 [Pseudomonadota bacterium]|nr:50S ribosomal protein L6 [Alphaproteobacteria bacterium]MDP5012779.1 50S ribosomal protein L6 [Alphaproteobacteria bacterium]MDP5370040.1 50S ribosomal protein L6 [Pseudomonadota bacterium]
MSRVGKNEIVLPNDVTLANDNGRLTVKGKFGTESYTLPECVLCEKTDNNIKLQPKDQSMRVRSLWGTAQRTVANMVKGVSAGFTVNLALVGVGYRASVAGNKITLQLGFSHDVVYDLPAGITAKCEKPTEIAITGSSKQTVGQIAAEIRNYRKPEPYKGKGVIRENEYVVRKEGKKK